MYPQYKPKELFLEEYNYDSWSENEEQSDEKSTELPAMAPQEDNEEEAKEGKELKVLNVLFGTNY